MAKGQQRGNSETKKPKQDKVKVKDTPSPFTAVPGKPASCQAEHGQAMIAGRAAKDSRLVLALSALALSASVAAAQPSVSPPPSLPAPATIPSPPHTERVVSEAEAARQRTESREREWDRKMRASTKSICKGC